jgi:CRP-like cAMP-binding protein
MTARVIDHVDLFRDLEPALRARIAQIAKLVTLHAGDEVARIGDINNSLIVVARGVLEVGFERDGDHAPVARLGTGDFFGEMSLLTGSPSNVTVTALCDTVALEIGKEALGPILESNPDLAKRLGDIVIRRKIANDTNLRALPPRERQAVTREQADDLLVRIRGFFAPAAIGSNSPPSN